MKNEVRNTQVQACAADGVASKSDRIGPLSGPGHRRSARGGLANQHSRRSLWIRIAGAIVLIMLAAAGPARAQLLAAGTEIRGRVIDAETKQPVEGVQVVAVTTYYTIVSPLQMHAGEPTTLHITEAVTDANGEYQISAWGPRLRPVNSVMNDGNPSLRFFKPGYRIAEHHNYGPPTLSLPRSSKWEGKVIELEPFRGAPTEWALNLGFLQDALGWPDGESIFPLVNDQWKHVPRTVLAIAEARRELPGSLRWQVRDLKWWKVTEAELQRRAVETGSSR